MEYLYVRLNLYDLLRRIFIGEPDVTLLLFLKEINVSDFTGVHFSDVPTVSQYLQLSLSSLEDKVISDCSDDFHNLHWDFTRLFIGPDTLPAAPWESSYKNNGLLFTETTLQVAMYYQQHGFCLPENEVEAADHVGFELDFIYHLNNKILSPNSPGQALLKDNLTCQVFFIENHLMAFVGILMNNVARHAYTDFYKNMALFTAEFIKFDLIKLKSLLSAM